VYQVRYGSNSDYSIIALAPSSPAGDVDLTIEAFNYAESYRTPVFILSDEIISHMRERVTIPTPDKIRLVERKNPTCRRSDSSFPGVPRRGAAHALLRRRIRPAVSSFARTETGRPVTDFKNQSGWSSGSGTRSRSMPLHRPGGDRGLEDARVAVLSYGSVAERQRTRPGRCTSRGNPWLPCG